MKKPIALAFWFCGVLTSTSAFAEAEFEDMPEIKIMTELSAQWISEQTTLNGLPASIRSFKGPIPVDDVVEHYQQQWSGGKGSVVRQSKEWNIVSTKYKNRFVSLHVRADGRGSQGLIVVSGDPAEYASQNQTAFPLPPDLKLLNRQTFLDSGARAETITLQSERPASVEQHSIENELTADGWTLLESRAAETAENAVTMEFRKGKQRARVFMASDKKWDSKTMILITWLQG